MYRIEHIDNTTTGTCKACENYDVITLERFNDKNIYVCDACRIYIEKEISEFEKLNPLSEYHWWLTS